MQCTLSAYRAAAGLTVRQLSLLTGITPAALSQIETGKRIPRADTLRRLADVLGTTMDALYPPAKSK